MKAPTDKDILIMAQFLAKEGVYNTNEEFIFDVKYHLEGFNIKQEKYIDSLIAINNIVFINTNLQ